MTIYRVYDSDTEMEFYFSSEEKMQQFFKNLKELNAEGALNVDIDWLDADSYNVDNVIDKKTILNCFNEFYGEDEEDEED